MLHHTNVAETRFHEGIKPSEDPDWVVFDTRGATGIDIPAVKGLLAFLRIDGEKETITKLLLLDDLARGFLNNIRFCGNADRVAYKKHSSVSECPSSHGASVR